MAPSPCRSLRTHRCPQDASAGHCQALRHLHPLHRRLSQGPRPVVPLSLMSLSRSLRKGLLPASQRPPGAANRHDASLSSGSRSGQRHRPICEKNRPSPVPGAVLPDAKFLSLFNEWKRRVHRLLEARFLFSVLGTVIDKGALRCGNPMCFNSLVRVR